MTVLVPDGITPMVGWRVWRWSLGMPGSGRLHSVHMPAVWEPHVPLRASCNGEPSKIRWWLRAHGLTIADDFVPPSPVDDCQCGIYAIDKPDVRLYFRLGVGEIRVLGRVALWGKVVVHETGWRGEYAYPQALYVPDEHFLNEKEALEVYGVPVLRWSEQNWVTEVDPYEVQLRILAGYVGAGRSGGVATISTVSSSTPEAPAGPPWYIRPLHLLAVAAWLVFMAWQFDNLFRLLWWGANGGSSRPLIAVPLVVGASLLMCWYARILMRIWRWQRFAAGGVVGPPA